MGLFDDVVLNAKAAAQTVGKKAGQLLDLSKLRISLSELNGEVNRRFQELGQFVYEAKQAGAVDDALLAEKLAEIDDLYAQIEAVTAQLAQLQKKNLCPVCGKPLAQDAHFCSNCGAKVEKPAEEPAAEPETETEPETPETPEE